jgi:hypothetical protein
MPTNARGVRKPVTPEERLDLLPYPPEATSAPLGWSNVHVEHFRMTGPAARPGDVNQEPFAAVPVERRSAETRDSI